MGNEELAARLRRERDEARAEAARLREAIRKHLDVYDGCEAYPHDEYPARSSFEALRAALGEAGEVDPKVGAVPPAMPADKPRRLAPTKENGFPQCGKCEVGVDGAWHCARGHGDEAGEVAGE
jgi:hypothetical protein